MSFETSIQPPSAWEFFLAKYQQQLLVTLGVLLLLLLGGITIFFLEHHRNSMATQLLAVAEDPKGWQEVIDHYPHSMAAADAMLLLAQSERDSGDIEAANRTYALFLDRFPKNVLAINAIIGRAVNDDLKGDAVASANTYGRAAGSYPSSYAASLALMSQARLLARLGKLSEMQQVVRNLTKNYSDSIAASVMQQQLRSSQEGVSRIVGPPVAAP